MELKNIISIATFFLFVAYQLYAGYQRRSYLLFVLFLLPVMDLNLTPGEYGAFKVFDIISYLSVFMLFNSLKAKTSHFSFYFILCGLFAVIVFFGSLVSEFIEVSLLEYIRFFTIFVYGKLLLDELFVNPNFINQVLKGLKFSCLVSLVLLLFQFLHQDPFLSFYLEEDLNPNIDGDAFIRYPGYFSDPQVFAQFLAMLSFLFLIPEKKDFKTSILNYLLFALAALALFMTGGRSAMGGMLVGIVFIFLFAGYRYLFFAVVCGITGFIAIRYFSDYLVIFNRGDTGQDLKFRVSVWIKAFKIFLNHPFFGIGIGNYQSYVALYDKDQHWDIRGEVVYFDQPENGYLKILSEMGLFGFVLFMIFILKPVVSGLWFYLTRWKNPRILFLIASLLSWMVAFMTVYSIGDVRLFVVVVSVIGMLISSCMQYKIVDVPAESLVNASIADARMP